MYIYLYICVCIKPDIWYSPVPPSPGSPWSLRPRHRAGRGEPRPPPCRPRAPPPGEATPPIITCLVNLCVSINIYIYIMMYIYIYNYVYMYMYIYTGNIIYRSQSIEKYSMGQKTIPCSPDGWAQRISQPTGLWPLQRWLPVRGKARPRSAADVLRKNDDWIGKLNILEYNVSMDWIKGKFTGKPHI